MSKKKRVARVGTWQLRCRRLETRLDGAFERIAVLETELRKTLEIRRLIVAASLASEYASDAAKRREAANLAIKVWLCLP